MSVQFDPAEFVRRLEAQGVPRAQALAHVDVLRDTLLGGMAARGDVEQVSADIDGLRGTLVELHGRVDGLASGVRADVEALRRDLDDRLEAIAARIVLAAPEERASKRSVVGWVLGVVFGLIGGGMGFAMGAMFEAEAAALGAQLAEMLNIG